MIESQLQLDGNDPSGAGAGGESGASGGGGLSLDRLERGVCAVVSGVDADDQDIQRLMSMGLCSGRTIELIKQGDPMIVRVFGSRVGISQRLGEKVMVQVCEQTGCDPAEGEQEEAS